MGTRVTPMNLRGRTAVITGAGSGIGRALAVALAAKGTHVVLTDVDAAGLAGTRALLEPSPVRVTAHELDVTDAQAVAAFPALLAPGHASIDLLVNNAGVALGGTFEQIAPADFEWLFAVNFWGVVRMTRAFLPMLRASDDARIVNLSSIFGIIAPAGQSAYVASKFAVRGFSLSLAHELSGTSVGVTVVHPGGVATSIAERAREPAGISAETLERNRRTWKRMLRMPPARAAEIIVAAIERRRSRVIVGRDAAIAALAERLAPVSYGALLRRLAPKS